MRSLDFGRRALSGCVAAAMLRFRTTRSLMVVSSKLFLCRRGRLGW